VRQSERVPEIILHGDGSLRRRGDPQRQRQKREQALQRLHHPENRARFKAG
jgi:hypothetical protein